MADSNKRNSSQQLILDHLIQQMAAGIAPQGQYSQFGFVTPPDVLWPNKENSCIPPLYDCHQTPGFDIDIEVPKESQNAINNPDLYFTPISPVSTSGSYLGDIFACNPGAKKSGFSNEIPPEPSHAMHESSYLNVCVNSSPTLLDFHSDEIPQSTSPINSSTSNCETKPSYSDIVSKISSNRVTSVDTSRQSCNPSPVITGPVKNNVSSGGSMKNKSGYSKSGGKVKRHSSAWSNESGTNSKDVAYDSPRMNQRKLSNGQKRSDYSSEKKRRNSVDSAFNYGLENISLDDPTPKARKDSELSAKGISESGSVEEHKPEIKSPDAPLNNEQASVNGQGKASVSKRPLNINNNLCSSKSNGRSSPAGSDVVSGTVLKSCNQEEWSTINKNKVNKSDSYSKSNEPLSRKSSDNKSRNVKTTVSLSGSSTLPQNKSEKRQKEIINKRRKRKYENTYPYFEEISKTILVYVTAWANITWVFMMWLFHLVCDVSSMSSKLLFHLLLISLEHIKVLTHKISSVIAIYLKNRLCNVWPFNSSNKKSSGGLTENIVLPATGEDAMKRLLACRGEDPYGILGVTSNCSDEDIKKFYKRQAILVHPDKNRQPGAEEAFKVLGHAFDLIGEPMKRKEYDDKTVKEKQMSAAMQEFSDLIKQLHRKMEEAANTICCTNCNGKHKRQKTDRPCFCARYCKKCEIRHAAREGDLWAESSMFGFLWHYYSCMDGAVYDITQWAACQSDRLKHLQANTHVVQYRIVTGGNNNNSNRWGGRKQQHDIPSEADLEEFLNNIYQQTIPGSGKTNDRMNKQASTSKRKMKKKRN